MRLTGSHDVAQLIQLAVAPVFVLMAVSGTLGVLSSRLGRIIDRGRALEGAAHDLVRASNPAELSRLGRRARLVYWSVSLATVAAICVSVLIALAFIGNALDLDVASTMALLFVAAMFAYTGALLALLREVTLAIFSFRMGLGVEAPTAHRTRG